MTLQRNEDAIPNSSMLTKVVRVTKATLVVEPESSNLVESKK